LKLLLIYEQVALLLQVSLLSLAVSSRQDLLHQALHHLEDDSMKKTRVLG